MRIRVTLSLVACLAAPAVVVAQAPTPPDDERVVRVRVFQFAPDTLRVVAGTRVRFANDDETRHTATSEGGDPAAAFDLRLDGRGASGALTLLTPGRIAYACTLHPHMTGVIEVRPR